MKTTGIQLALAAVIVLGLTAPAAGQVYRTQLGGALDASYRVGSHGRNTAAVLPNVLDSQLYLHGQVTGLSAFHGRLGYRAPNQLNLALPSASLGSFRRRSVGVQSALSGLSYRVAPYYERTTTALPGAQVTSGVTLPGTNIPRATGVWTSLANRLYLDAKTRHRPIVPKRYGMAISVLPPVRSLGAEARPAKVKLPTDAGQDKGRESTLDRFRVLKTPTGRSLSEQSRQAQDARRVKAQIGRTGQVEGKERSKQPADPGRSPLADPTGEKARAKKAKKPAEPHLGQYRQNQDIFLDVLTKLQRQRVKARQAASTGRGPDRVELSKAGTVVIHSLAGLGPDEFNDCMRRAQELLAAGSYHKAAGQYELASAIDEKNPLARVGVGVALFSAGEPYAAAFQVRKALELLPGLMETQLNIRAMVKAADLKQALASLERRLAKRPGGGDAYLVFLAAFMNRNLGHLAKAKTHAARLRSIGGSDPVLAAYWAFILTGKRAAGTRR